jgi:transposase
LADWVGKTTALLEPLADAIGRHVLSAEAIFADDTPISMLAPGIGKTQTARLWTYARDERPWGGDAPPAAWYRFSGDRKGQHPKDHLARYRGWMHADGYAGFNALFERSDVTEAACWAHVRRKFFDIHAANQSPIAKQALDQIGALYAVEERIRNKPPDKRQRWRAEQSAPLMTNLKTWIEVTRPKLSGKTELAQAIRYAQSRWEALSRFLGDGRIEIDNNAAERAVRGIALGRKNWLFAGSDAGGKTAAAIFSLIETAKLNRIDPELYLRSVLTRIADHPINRIAELLPWRWEGKNDAKRAQPAGPGSAQDRA